MNNEINSIELSPYKAKISRVERAAEVLAIKTEEDLASATDLLSKIKEVARDIEGFKKSITDPMNLALKNARALFSPLEAGYAEAEAVVKQKMVSYRVAAEKKKFAEEAKIVKKIEQGKISEEAGMAKLTALPQIDNKVEGNKGTIQFKKVSKYEIIDYKKLPIEYLQANPGAIWKAVQSGVKEISGCRIWEEEIVAGGIK